MAKKLKPLKDKDSVAQTRYWLTFLYAFFATLPVVIVLSVLLFGEGMYLFFVVAALAVLVAMVAAFSASRLMDGSYGFMEKAFGKRSWRPLKEQLAGDVSRIHYFKREGDFDQALGLADEILEQEPDFPEVLLLKAQVLNDGLGRRDEAIQCLRQLLRTADRKDPNFRWARRYYIEMTGEVDISSLTGPAGNKTQGE